MKSFTGGLHIREEKKRTAGLPIEKAKAPERVIIPMVQHIGAPCEPLVKPGDTVKAGQKVGDSKSFISAPVHASVSGKVIAVEPYTHPLGSKILSVIIENNYEEGLLPVINPVQDISKLTPEEIKSAVREAGIVGLGGAAFPTHVKLTPPQGKSIDTYILNGAECEPYLTSDERLMTEESGIIIRGMKILMKAAGVTRGFVGIEDNKPGAIRAMEAEASKENIKVIKLKTKYPQGAERHLVKATTGHTVPAGQLPVSVGVVVNNVATAAAVGELFLTGTPLIERVVTVTGSGIKEPKNLRVKIGATFADVIAQCGGLDEKTAKVIMGGPMMGIAQHTLDVPVIKGCSGILILTESEVARYPAHGCIRCGKCISKCPMGLSPAAMGVLAEKEQWDAPELKRALDCIECGLCAFICPSKRPLVQYFKQAKSELQKPVPDLKVSKF